MNADAARVQVRITGRVQGVGFRYAAADEARRLGVEGWVRNTADGGVDLVAEGPRPALERLVSWCHGGPPGALVTHLDETWEQPAGGLGGFRIRA